MANEEQRRAFESYMGRSGASSGQGQPIPQYPGSVAQPGNPNPYLFNPFPGLGVPPAAPTPPPAATSSVASFPGYQGGYPQAAYGQGGWSQNGVRYDQNGIPQRPPPLGDPQTAQQGQQPPQAGPSGYGQVPGNYNAQPPPPQGYNAGWQYNNQNAELERRRSGAPAGAMVPSSRNLQQEIVESRGRQTSEQYHYQQYGQSQPTQAPPPQVEEVAVPVMLCHTCSDCGQMRSAGFHRNNPVVPGKPLIPTPCRRCKKKIKSSHRSSSRYTRIRKCTADEPCDWPRESIHIDIDHERNERRGRRTSREEVYVTRYSPSRPHIVRQESGQHRSLLRSFQQEPEEVKTYRKVQTSSLSPRRSSRYAGEVWPPPDIVRMRATRSDEVSSAPPEPLPSHPSRSDEVWPPPDVIRTHSYRKVERSPPRRESSRIIELSPSPPPARTRSTRVVYRSESQERRPRSLSSSPVRVSFSVREDRRSEEAEARLMSHPRPFRPIVPEPRTMLRASDETASNTDSMYRRRGESPGRSILKPGGTDRETNYRRRDSMRESQQSMHVEVGGPRVHFGGGRREEAAPPEPRGRPRYAEERASIAEKNAENYEHYREFSRHRYVNDPPPEPPTQDFERIRIRHSSTSPRRDYEDEIRIDRQRRLSPSPPPPRRYEEVRVRHTSPLPLRRTARPPPSPERPPPPPPPQPLFRHVSRPRAIEHTRSDTPPPPPSRSRRVEEDHTDSESAHSGGEITEVRSWRGIDENGKPATFVEERRTVRPGPRMIDQGSERGGGLGSEYRSLRGSGERTMAGGRERERERVGTRSWRDV